MHKIFANPQNICKSTKKFADFHVGIVVISKNLQMNKILVNRKINRFLTKYLQIDKTSASRRSLTYTSNHGEVRASGCASPASATSRHCPSPPASIAFDGAVIVADVSPSNSPDRSSTKLFNRPDIFLPLPSLPAPLPWPQPPSSLSFDVVVLPPHCLSRSLCPHRR